MDKKAIFQGIVKKLNGNKAISNMTTNEDEAGFTATFSVYEDIACTYNMRKNGDISIIKAEAYLPESDDADPSVIAADATQDVENVRYTIYDGKIVFQKATPFEDTEDVNSVVQGAVKDFINMLVNNAEFFKCSFHEEEEDTVNDADNSDAADEEDDDLYLSEDEAEDDEDDEYEDEEEILDSDEDTETDFDSEEEDVEESDEDTASISRQDLGEEIENLLAELDDLTMNQNNRQKKTAPKENSDTGKRKGQKKNDKAATHTRLESKHLSSLEKEYTEMNAIFSEREEALEHRERKLNAYAEVLQKKADDLEKKEATYKENVKAELREQEEKIFQQKEQLQTGLKTLSLEKKKVAAELSTIQSKKMALEEEIAMHMENSPNDIRQYQEQITELKAQLSEMQEAAAHTQGDDESVQVMGETIEKQKVVIDKLKQGFAEEQQTNKELQKEISRLSETGDMSASADFVPAKEYDDMRKKLKSETNRLNRQVKNLKKQLAEKPETAETTVTADDTQLEDALKAVEEKQSQIAILEIQVKDMAAAKEKAETGQQSAENETAKLKQQLADMEQKIKEQESQPNAEPVERDLQSEALSIIEDFKAIGITLEIVPGNAEMILAGTSDTTTICVNVAAGMGYVERAVKKVAQHKAVLEKWNAEDIRYAYYISQDKIVCKCQCQTNTVKSMHEAITKIKSL